MRDNNIKDSFDQIFDQLDRIESRIDELLGGTAEPEPPKLDPDKWIKRAQTYIGLDEEVDEGTVIELAKVAGTPISSSETPWCAIFVNAVLATVGLATTGTMRARDFESYGEECQEKIGAIVVYRSHVGFVPEFGKVLGGNQSDGVNIGEQSWYGKPICYRWPVLAEGDKKK